MGSRLERISLRWEGAHGLLWPWRSRRYRHTIGTPETQRTCALLCEFGGIAKVEGAREELVLWIRAPDSRIALLLLSYCIFHCIFQPHSVQWRHSCLKRSPGCARRRPVASRTCGRPAMTSSVSPKTVVCHKAYVVCRMSYLALCIRMTYAV
jgi:hypothetical protein